MLGEMLELGRASEELHREVGRYAAERGIDLLIGVRGAARGHGRGGRAAGMAETPRCSWRIRRRPAISCAEKRAEGDAVLFKGSRGVRMERALERFMA